MLDRAVSAMAGRPAAKIEVRILTEDGLCLTFPNVANLLLWQMRMNAIYAICLDGRTWRTYDSFRDLLAAGLTPLDAFDQAERVLVAA